jgi:8-oxo-dGTP diphosphatase
MINLSIGAAAFLKRGDEYLLMKRADNRKIAPGVWSAVGGKLETYELNDPQAACLREVQEETGITAVQIYNLKLRYVIVRR